MPKSQFVCAYEFQATNLARHVQQSGARVVEYSVYIQTALDDRAQLWQVVAFEGSVDLLRAARSSVLHVGSLLQHDSFTS